MEAYFILQLDTWPNRHKFIFLALGEEILNGSRSHILPHCLKNLLKQTLLTLRSSEN